MTDNIEWFCLRYVRITPNSDSIKKPSDSWQCENAKNLLQNDNRIYAINVNDKKTHHLDGFLLPIHRSTRKKKSPLKKLAEKYQWKLPYTMLIFSLIQCIFHLVETDNVIYQTLAFSPICKLEIWRFLTYAILHAGFAHLMINIILQIVISFPLESEQGHFKVLLVYLGGILSGSLAASMSGDNSLMVGASSGIYSLLMSHASHIIMNFTTLKHRYYRITFVVFLSLSDVIYSIVHCLVNRNTDPKIHIIAHIAGAISGIILGFLIYNSTNYENICKQLKCIAGITYATFFLITVIVNAMQL